MTDGRITDRSFYETDALTLARNLIGKTLVYESEAGTVSGIIAETEAYMGVTDRASHAFGGRRTTRTETMYLPGGYAYVYLIYGLYACMNVTAAERDNPEAVLIRAVLPTEGIPLILQNVREKSRRKTPPIFPSEPDSRFFWSLTNGPGKLCQAMGITRALNGSDMTAGAFYIRDDGLRPLDVLTAPRIGIDYAGEARDYPWRFTAAQQDGVPAFIH